MIGCNPEPFWPMADGWIAMARANCAARTGGWAARYRLLI